jgi:muramoyltetrapeptide carboxypeptidase
MDILKPPALKRGDVIGLVAPSSPPKSLAQLSRAIRYVEQLGYRVELGKHMTDRRGYLAGSDKARAADINEFFLNPTIKAILSVRGGYGVHRILPLLNYRAIRGNPKILVGYSDITGLHLALFTKTGLVTFSGPMAATDLGERIDGNAEEWFWRCLTSTKPLGRIMNPDGKRLRSLRGGHASGVLLGGNLSIVSTLAGTPYSPSFRGSLLLLEDVDEAPYRIDRMLNHLRLAGVFGEARAVLLGEFTNCVPVDPRTPTLTLNQVFDDILVQANRPVLGGLHFGHTRSPLTLPLGVRCRVDATKRRVDILESTVS